MRLKALALVTVVSSLAFAPSVFAWGGNGTKEFTKDGRTFRVVKTDNGFQVFEATEPLALLAVGAGLLGARLLRRRSS